MGARDIGLAIAALFVIAVGASLLLLAAALLGVPALVAGVFLGLGAFGLIAIFGAAVAFVSLWYVVYTLLKSVFEKEKVEPSGNYTLDRLRRS